MSSNIMEISASSGIDWGQTIPGQPEIKSPLRSVAIEVGYPDYADPVGMDGQPVLAFRAEGVPMFIGKAPAPKPQLMCWTRENSNAIFTVSFIKLDAPMAGWGVDEVLIRKTIAFDPNDPRVDLAGGGSVKVTEQRMTGPAPRITADDVGLIHIRFRLNRPIPTSNISIALVCVIGERRDVFTINAKNQDDVAWELYSDKYFDQASFTYELSVAVAGIDFFDQSIQWRTVSPVEVRLPQGRIKSIDRCTLTLPPPPADKIEAINQLIKAAQNDAGAKGPW
jgi:hypothetical protein